MDKEDVARQELLEEELLLIKNSGELPEVAYHGALYFLTAFEDGPRLCLTEMELKALEHAVVEQYKNIMLRDLTPSLRDHRRYRGVARCYVNWQRLGAFASKKVIDINMIRLEVCACLKHFLETEISDVVACRRSRCLNLSMEELLAFLQELSIDPQDWRSRLAEVYSQS